MADNKLYRITFHNQGKIYEVYARKVYDAPLLGFVQIQDLLFGERSGIVVDPSEERIRDEFEGVECTYLPMHAIIRIDQVDRQGVSKISDADGTNVAQFPLAYSGPKGGNKEQ